MKIAFLHAGFPPDALRARHGDYLTMFQQRFAAVDPDIHWVDFRVQQGMLPKTLTDHDAFLCCGSAHSVYDPDPWIPPLLDFVRRVHAEGGRMAGICFGHQLIAQALGGSVIRAPQGWGLGCQSTTLRQTPPWMKPALTTDTLKLLYSHQDQVVSLPKEARILTSSSHCPIAGFTMDDQFLAFQGHPEIDPPYLQDLMNHRRQKIGDDRVDHAMQSLHTETHHHQVMQWIHRFLRGSA